MNISSINSYTPPESNSRSLVAEAPTAEARQARTSDITSTQAKDMLQVSNTEKAETNRQALDEAVKAVNDFLKPINNSLQFNIDDETGKTIVKVVDSTTNELIRQFPSEEMLSIAKAIDQMKGLLIQQKA